MSARSSVTRQTSQESDANNNFGSTLMNGQQQQQPQNNIPFVVPNTSIPSYQAAVAMQQMQRMNGPQQQQANGGTNGGGGNPGQAYQSVRNTRPLMSTSAPSAAAALYGAQASMPVLHVQPGTNIQQHRMPGHQAHQLYTIFLPNQAGQTGQMVPGQANAQYLGGQYPQDPMTSPPPNSSVPGAFYPPTYTSFGTPQMAYGGYGQFAPNQAFINTPGGPFIYQGAQAAAMAQQQQQQAAAVMAYQMGQQQQQQQQQQGGPPEFGTPSVPGGGGGGGPQSVPTSMSVMPQVSSANYGGMQAQMGGYGGGYQGGPPQQQQQQQMAQQHQPAATVRKRNILQIVDPNTKENVMEQVLKEKEEADQRQHEQYVQGGVWKPPPGSQTMYMDTGERQPSRSQSATPQSMSGGQLQGQGMDMSQTDVSTSAVHSFYNAITEAAIAPNQPNQSSPPQSLTSSSHQDERVILPPEHGRDRSNSSAAAHLQFGVDDNDFVPSSTTTNTTATGATSKKPLVQTSGGLEFGFTPSDDPMPTPAHAGGNFADESSGFGEQSMPEESIELEEPDIPNLDGSDIPRIDEREYPQLRRPDLLEEAGSETASIAAASMQVQFDAQSSVADDSIFDASSIQDQSENQSQRLGDDSPIDASSVADDGDKLSELVELGGAIGATGTGSDEAGATPGTELTNITTELEQLADPDGKLKYSREFMCAAAKLPEAKVRPQFDTTKWTPENLNDVFELGKKTNNQQFRSSFPASGSATDFNTPWMKTGGPGGPPSGGRKVPYGGRFSDKNQDRGPGGGGRGSRGPPGGRGSQIKQLPIIIPQAVVDVELKTTENAWRPGKQVENADPDTQKLLKEVRGLLNKITPQTFDELSKEFLELEPRMNTVERCTGIVEIVFQKAVEDPNFCTMYSDLYDRMTKVQLQRQQQAAGQQQQAPTKSSSLAMNKDTNFRYILLTKCQNVFEKDTKFQQLKKDKVEAMEKAETPEIKNQLQADLDELISKERRQSLGNMRFIGELYHRNMLTAKIMHFCVSGLLRKVNDDPEALESLCKLLSVIGNKFENDKKSGDFQTNVNGYYVQLEAMTQNPQLPSRFKFMILDLLDLRKNGWEARQKSDGPKTIDQLHHDAQVEKINQQIALEQQEANRQADSPSRGSRRGGGPRRDLPARGSYGTPGHGDYDNRGARGSMGRDAGRQHGQQAPVQESSSQVKKPSLSHHLGDVKFGPQRGAWNKGASGAGASSPAMGAATLPRGAQDLKTANRFESLLYDGERRSPASSRESSQTRQHDEKRSALDHVRQLVGAASSKPSSNERQDGSPHAPRVEITSDTEASSTIEMDEEKMKRYSNELIDELVDTGDFKEAIGLVRDRAHLGDRILSLSIYHVMEKSEKHRRVLGELMARWQATEGLAGQVYKGFALFIDNANDDDLAQDVPKLWQYAAQVLGSALVSSESNSSDRRLVLNEFRDTFDKAGGKSGAEFLAQTLLVLKRTTDGGDSKLGDIYRSVSDDPIFANEKVTDAFKKHELDFLLAEKQGDSIDHWNIGPLATTNPTPVSLPPYGMASPTSGPGAGATPTALLRMGSVHSDLDADKAELERLIKTGGDELAVDQLIAFLQSTRRFDDETDERSLTFLGALIQSLCSKAIVVKGELDDINVNVGELERFCKVLLPFVKSKRSYEMKILDVLAEIYQGYNCPKGVLVKILSALEEEGVIEKEGFIEWWRTNEQTLPGMIRQNGEVKSFFAHFFEEDEQPTSDAGTDSEDQGE